MTRKFLLIIVAGTFALSAGGFVVAQDTEQGAGQAGDAGITSRVKDRLAQKDPEVAPRIEVSTRDGIVTLHGVALTQQYILNALQDARSVDGVVKVENRLTVE